MIVYDKFWETMKRCGESTYTLINHYNISSGTIDRIRKGQGNTTAKLDDFCQIFPIIKCVDHSIFFIFFCYINSFFCFF